MATEFDDTLDTGSEDMGTLEDLLSENTSTNTQTDDTAEEDLPEKYKGKSPKEIIKMHQEAEKLASRQGNEVGELRKVVDDFIRVQTSNSQKATQGNGTEDDDEVEIFTDPSKAVNKLIDKHPAVQQAKEAAMAMKRAETLSRLAKDFPDFMTTVEDPSFREWVQTSRNRTQMFNDAERNFSYDSAEELLEAWKERTSYTKTITDTSKLDREKQLNAANVSTSSTTESVPKKKYRRSDIVRLMQTDPARYESMSGEIMKAYQEGRVI